MLGSRDSTTRPTRSLASRRLASARPPRAALASGQADTEVCGAVRAGISPRAPQTQTLPPLQLYSLSYKTGLGGKHSTPPLPPGSFSAALVPFPESNQQKQLVINKAVGGSRFAVTCGLLRQYMKEQGGTGATALAPGADAAAEEGKATMLELFPQQAGTLKDDLQRKMKEPVAERAPLTIFYDGKMVVFDDFPAEKAQELMQLAGSGTAAAAGQNALGQPRLTVTDMPIARKASLKRFLEKRKNRLTAGDPYPAAASELMTKPVKQEDAAPWLGVSSALSLA